MYFSAQPAPETAPGEFRALRLSLNAPVVTVDELPVGPARAGIALCEGPDGAPRLVVAVRSLRSDRVAFYGTAEEPDRAADPRLRLDAGLSFAESMGFLFDDDEVEAGGDDGPARAARLWRDLLGADAPPEAVLLEDVVGPPALSIALPLTKFRRVAVAAATGGRGT